MNDDEMFARALRDQVDRVAPSIDVDTDAVLPRARRHRARRVAATGVASALTVALVGGWAATAQPWTPDVQAMVPAGIGSSSPSPTSTRSDPGSGPSLGAGWQDGPFWYVRWRDTTELDGESEVVVGEGWFGRSEPGVIISDGDTANPSSVFGPRPYGELLLDGERVLIDWDELYGLPTDPSALEEILRGTVRGDRGQGTPEDKMFEMARELLEKSPASPALRDAVWEVMSGLDAAEMVGGSSDAEGRQGSGLVYRTDAGGRYELVYASQEHRLLETTTVTASQGAVWRTTYLEERVSDGPPIEPTLEMAGCTQWATC